MTNEEKTVQNTEEDQAWADLLSSLRRQFMIGAGLTATGIYRCLYSGYLESCATTNAATATSAATETFTQTSTRVGRSTLWRPA